MAGGESVHTAKVLSAPVAAHWSRMINGWTWPNSHLALTASGDKSGALVRDGVYSALQGQGLTPTETLEENGLNIHCRQAERGRQTAHLETSRATVRDVSRCNCVAEFRWKYALQSDTRMELLLLFIAELIIGCQSNINLDKTVEPAYQGLALTWNDNDWKQRREVLFIF